MSSDHDMNDVRCVYAHTNQLPLQIGCVHTRVRVRARGSGSVCASVGVCVHDFMQVPAGLFVSDCSGGTDPDHG